MQSVGRLRLVMQCRHEDEAALCEHLAFAFARDAGLRGIDVWYAAACTASLASHLLATGGGEVELGVSDEPRPAMEVRARCRGSLLAHTPPELRAAERYANELRIAWHAGHGTVITARRWLRQ